MDNTYLFLLAEVVAGVSTAFVREGEERFLKPVGCVVPVVEGSDCAVSAPGCCKLVTMCNCRLMDVVFSPITLTFSLATLERQRS